MRLDMKKQAFTPIIADKDDTKKSYDDALFHFQQVEKTLEKCTDHSQTHILWENKSQTAELICVLAKQGYEPAHAFVKLQLESSAKAFDLLEKELLKTKGQSVGNVYHVFCIS